MSVRTGCIVSALLAAADAEDLVQQGMAADTAGACWPTWARLCGVTFPAALELGAEQVLMGLGLPMSVFVNVSQFFVVKCLLVGHW